MPDRAKFFSGRASVESARSKRKEDQETYREDVQDTMESPY
jgi:hypothetical protein